MTRQLGWGFANTIRGKILAVFVLINLVATCAYSFYIYSLKSDTIRQEIDKRLHSATAAAPLMLPRDYFDRAQRPDAVSGDEYRRLMADFDRYCQTVGLRYLYVFMPVGERLVYLMDSATPAEVQRGRYGRYFTAYEGPVPTLKDILAEGRPRFVEYRDHYGEFRSLFVPGVTADGRPYLIGADVGTSYITSQLRDALRQSLFIGFATFGVGLLLSLLLTWQLSRPVEALVSGVRRIEAGDYTARVAWRSRDELGQLATSFNTMSGAVAEREREMLRLAFVDPLTGLANRTRLIEAIESHLSGGPAHFAVVLFDLDQFKYINDYLGYQVGDAAIAALGRRLGGALGGGGEVCARLSGDEYAVLFPETNAAQLPERLARIEAMLAQPVVVAGQRLELGASIGVALYPEHGDSGDLLLRHAEVAMYAAKRLHHGHAVYDPGFEQNRQTQLALLSDLRNAVAENQFVVCYQPKVRMKDGEIDAAEALVRWRHPERGWIPPNDFIPFAEQTGRLRAITQWVIEDVLERAVQWAREGIVLTVSVNVGMSDAEDAAFVDFVEDALIRLQADPARLCLEITETGGMSRQLELMGNLERLRRLGVKLSIDDFGTGYSSFAYLAQMPVHELKIDRSFVQALDFKFENVSIVRSIIELGHILGLQVVAEGVETESAWQALAIMGCDEAQGYLVAKPMPAEDFLRWYLATPLLPYTPPDMSIYDTSVMPEVLQRLPGVRAGDPS
ncbi:putative bifunctional diguanylate cyclase/phosphodiesterase [Chitiniphilus eburneus]|uniref:EAL domain-containing protein n=1 Tax=Chitiniphilus eburneus TaxID=2571148 RepID=A0A4U0PLV6_9NEIS|nr:GGDEF domain-containing protein [Chitiniphilus eburneus]TJZ69045.1 EAL domain-containing protein [Chitiniphilus eburneus]